MASQIWKLNGRRGIVYIEGKKVAEQVMVLCGEKETQLSEQAMAVYIDPRGRPFAWQIPFDLARWDTVSAAVEEWEQSQTVCRK